MRSHLVAAFATALLASAALATNPDPSLLAGLKARSIGPAGMSGRVAAIDAVESNPSIVYVGAATGGVWKSHDGGITWTPIFDHEKVAAVGAVSVYQPNPDIVWVGTGEGNVRNSASVGNGVYRSLDGGHTWIYAGLDGTERIPRIALDPTDPNVAYVAAMGREWGENPMRGVFKTVDGGKTWTKILYVDERTGCADLVIDPSNPNKLFAAMWDYRRWPWSFRSGGPGSGLYVTVDGGATWKRLTEDDGLPAGELGRIGVSICRDHPETVYALVEAKKSALCRSDDGGITWRTVNRETNVASRPFYYADIRVDPERPDRLYNLASRISVSDDGGKSFTGLTSYSSVHPDFHAIWIDPTHPGHVIVGDDGGVSISYDRGATWRFVGNLPLAQYYHVNVDMDVPYHVYGGMQDNGSWRGPSTVWERGGIRNLHWDEVGFGDGFDVSPDPTDSMQGYAMSQTGFILRWNLRTGERRDIRPPAPAGVKLRFNWNAGFAQDPFDAGTIYYGSQFLHRSTDRGASWEIISPDLTSNNPDWQKQDQSGGLTLDVTGAENYTSIVAIAPSPVQRGVIWVGTDDGRLHVTRDGGATWTSVEGRVTGVPANTWIPHIRASRFDAGTAFVVFDDHRRSNWTPYVYETTDFGKTWSALATKNLWGYCLSIEQDPVDAKLLFLGTEFGLWVSQDGGGSWWKFTQGVPTVAVRDLVVQPREQDLVIATHGRGLYIIDDIRPLRTLSAESMRQPLHLFPIPDAQQARIGQGAGERFPGDSAFSGENRPYGALVTFTLDDPSLPLPDPDQERARKATAPEAPAKGDKSEAKPRATITIKDSAGATIRTFKTRVTEGLNRAVWNLRRDGFRQPPRERESEWEDRGGIEVLPGAYTVTVSFGGHTASEAVKVAADPRFDVAAADRLAKQAALMEAGALQERVADAVKRIADTRADIEVVLRKTKPEKPRDGEEADADDDSFKDVRKAAKALQAKLDDLEKRFRVPPDTKGYVDYDDALGKVRYAMSSLSSSWDAPTPSQRAYLADAASSVAKAVEQLDAVFAKDVAGFRDAVRSAGIVLLPEAPPLAAEAPK